LTRAVPAPASNTGGIVHFFLYRPQGQLVLAIALAVVVAAVVWAAVMLVVAVAAAALHRLPRPSTDRSLDSAP
jgi:hypothetical protein